MFVVETIHIVITLISLVGAAGWVVSYLEYRARVKAKELHSQEILNLGKEHNEILIKQLELSDTELKLVKDKFKEELSELQDKLKQLEEVREEDLKEAEQIVKAKVEEIEKAYKEVLDDQNASLELYESYIKNFDATITLVDERLKILDEKGLFATDDEIGFFFSYVRNLQDLLGRFKIKKEELDKQQEDNKEA